MAVVSPAGPQRRGRAVPHRRPPEPQPRRCPRHRSRPVRTGRGPRLDRADAAHGGTVLGPHRCVGHGALLPELLELPPVDLAVEGFRDGPVAGHQLVPGEGAGLVVSLHPEEVAGLPEPVCRARRVHAEAEPSQVGHVGRRGEGLAAVPGGPRHGGVDVLDAEVGRPHTHASLNALPQPGDGITTEGAHGIPARLGAGLRDVPAEEPAVEGAGAVQVADAEVDPARGPR